MLLRIISALSAVGAFILCAVTEAFDGLQWLWILPVSLLGGFLFWVLVAFLFLLLACAVVDPDKPQEKDSKFYRTLVDLYIEAILTVGRVHVEATGLEQIPKDGRFLLVCNHLHEADPPILLHYFRKSQLAFVSKQENKNMFLVGKVMPKLLCPLINRENDREALKTILRCIQLLKEDKVSVGIFPEGYIRPDRKFHNFRPGVFKIAQKANVPIVVCTIRDTHYIIPNFLKGKPSKVQLHLLTVVPADYVKSKTTVELAEEIHDIMAQDLGEDYRPEENT